MRVTSLNAYPVQHSAERAAGSGLGNAVVAFAFVGFPLAAAASQFVGLETNQLNILFRALYALLCIVLIIWIGSKGKLHFDGLIILFFFLYGARLLYDFGDNRFADIELHSQFFLATVVMPALAMSGGSQWYNERNCLRWVISCGALAGILIAYNNLNSNIDISLQEAREGRAWLTFLNPIAIGYHGVFLGVASTIYFFKYSRSIEKFFCVFVAILSIYLVVISGSRGPIVALAMGFLITSGANQGARVANVFLGCLVIAAIGTFGAPEIISERFSALGNDQSSSDRIYYLQQALNQALDSPVFGVAYIEPITGQYPHNLVVEAALALGIVGFPLMLMMQISIIVASWKVARRGEWWLPFSGCAMLANAWISGSIWGSGLFFVLLWLLRERTRTASTGRRPSHQLAAGY